jgi:hypothetical protein
MEGINDRSFVNSVFSKKEIRFFYAKNEKRNFFIGGLIVVFS